jgi:hypothetical protein
MSALELIALAASLSLFAGWRLYLTLFVTGLAVKFGWVELPTMVASLDVLARDWVLAISGAGTLAEFLADKVAWIDSLWDSVHTLVRPIGGALIALAVVHPTDPAWQVAALLLGGGGALLAHGAKSGTRALVNTSPEPFSNVAVSTVEDVATAGGLWLAFSAPLVAGGLALLVFALCAWIVWKAARFVLRRRPTA